MTTGHRAACICAACEKRQARLKHLQDLLREALPYVERCPVPYVVQTRNSLLERMRKEIPVDSTASPI